MTYANHSANAFFDLGVGTFKKVAQRYPEWFKPSLDKKHMSVKTEDFKRESARLLKESNIDASGFKSLQVVAGSALLPEQKILLDMLQKILLNERAEEWRQYGVIKLTLDSKNQQRMATDSYIGPIINTGIQRYENHQPFYNIVDRLYGKNGVRTYLDMTAATAGNKSPRYYYNNSYQDVNY